MPEERVANFSAGPSALPIEVLEEANKGLLNFNNTGIGIAEISHRSKEFLAFLANLEVLIREQLHVPATHSILFTQGGGYGQFSSVVLNMLSRHTLLHPDAQERTLDYVVTGSWSKKAAEEARRLAAGQQGARVNIVVDGRPYSKDAKSFDNIPADPSSYAWSQDPALIYYCDNETVDGVQFSGDPTAPTAFPVQQLLAAAQARGASGLLPLVADHSSSFMSRPIPHLADHAIIYAGAQKNIGPAGLTILIVRQDCLPDVDAAAALGAQPVPLSMAYKTLADSKSVFNTPPVLPIYVAGLVLERMKRLGGVEYFAEVNKRKSDAVYGAIAEGEEKGVFRRKAQKGSESWMNVVFEVLGEGKEADFLKGAEERGMKGLKGHRSVGGIRASLYNAITEEEVQKLVDYMKEFIAQSTPQAE